MRGGIAFNQVNIFGAFQPFWSRCYSLIRALFISTHSALGDAAYLGHKVTCSSGSEQPLCQQQYGTASAYTDLSNCGLEEKGYPSQLKVQAFHDMVTAAADRLISIAIGEAMRLNSARCQLHIC